MFVEGIACQKPEIWHISRQMQIVQDRKDIASVKVKRLIWRKIELRHSHDVYGEEEKL